MSMLIIIISKPTPVFDDQGKLNAFGLGSDKTLFSLGVITVTIAVVSFYVFTIIDLVFGAVS